MRWIRAMASMVLASMAPGRTSQPLSPPSFTARGAFFALSVADLDASVKWYAEKLGLAVVRRVPRQDHSAVAVLEGGGLIVELIQRDDARPLAAAAPGVTAPYLVHGLFKVGLIIDDFDKTLATLRQRGVDIAIGPFPARGDQRANVIIRDNGGNLIQIFGSR